MNSTQVLWYWNDSSHLTFFTLWYFSTEKNSKMQLTHWQSQEWQVHGPIWRHIDGDYIDVDESILSHRRRRRRHNRKLNDRPVLLLEIVNNWQKMGDVERDFFKWNDRWSSRRSDVGLVGNISKWVNKRREEKSNLFFLGWLFKTKKTAKSSMDVGHVSIDNWASTCPGPYLV